MKTGVVWPDIVIAGIVLLLGLRGFKRGFVGEVGGLVAICAAITAALTYPGFWDQTAHALTGADPAVAHWLGLGAYTLTAFAVVSGLAWMLGQIASLPIIGIANSLLGALTGAFKGLLLVWFIIYCALFFPLETRLRGDLRKSALVSMLVRPVPAIDGRVKDNVPEFARRFTEPLFRRHHV